MTQLPSMADEPAASCNVEETVTLVQEVFEQPTVTAARFLPSNDDSDSLSVHLSYSQRSLSAQTKRSLTQTVHLWPSGGRVQFRSPIVEVSSDIKHTAVSPDGQLHALFRAIPAKEAKESRRIVEIVETASGRRVDELDVTKEHGEWYFDATFGPPNWNHRSDALVYTAEAPPLRASTENSSRPSPAKFDYTPDFGETFIDKREPTLFLLVLRSSSYRHRLVTNEDRCSLHRLTYPGLQGKAVFGQPAFLPDAESPRIIATAYSPTDDERKLGIVYCQNRRARIYSLEINVREDEAHGDSAASGSASPQSRKTFRAVKTHPISSADRSARSPRVLPSSSEDDSAEIVYVSNVLGGVHASCAELRLANLAGGGDVKEDWTLVSVVDDPTDTNGVTDFPGLYLDQLPQEPFLVDAHGGARRIALTSTWRSRRVPLLVDLSTGKIQNLAPWPEVGSAPRDLPYPIQGSELDSLASYFVLGTDGVGRVLATRSAPTMMPQVVVCDAGSTGQAGPTQWTVVREATTSFELAHALKGAAYTVLPLPGHAPSELVLASPNKLEPGSGNGAMKAPPLIVQPHGGPHSAVTTEFSYSRLAALLQGYRFVDVNYPGSTGFGQRTIEDLPPKLGTAEVEATLAAARYLADLGLASEERKRKLLMGGSHGGWTACHLTARWPNEFGAVVMRNPVTDLVANASMTDIPDWCYEEAGMAYPLDRPPSLVTPEQFKRFYEISPMRHAHKVTTPTLLLIGLEDRRVPPNQGRAWYHALKNRGQEEDPVDVKMMTFPGNSHPIAETVEAEWAAWEAGFRWLVKYTDF
ncbi:hypothetical protein JCM8202_004732 [Rhodotorula sphaerocarpa]